MRGHSEGITKAHRVAAWKIVDEILSRPIPAVVARHNIEDAGNYNLEDRELILDRANHILAQLRKDAEDLWREG